MSFNPNEKEQLRQNLNPTMGAVSMIREVGVGIATENKVLSSKDCHFQVLEWFPLDQAEMKSDTIEITESGVDYKGEAYEVTVSFGKSIVATWLPDGSNRVTPPDIRRGERVKISRLGDSDTFYWQSIQLDQSVRRLETAQWLFSNTKDESVEELTPENSWMVEMSTHQKTMSVKMPKSDEEPFAYDIQLNQKDGTFLLQDDGGQSFELNSGERIWNFKNADGAEVRVEKKNITITAPETMKVICNDFILEAANSISEKSQSHKVSTQKYELSTQTYSNTSQSYKVSTSTWTVSFGTGTATGSMGFSGSLRNNGIAAGSTHIHPGVRSGDSTTAPPIG